MHSRQMTISDLVRDGVVTVRARPDIRRICLELSTACNLNCAMCIRSHWLPPVDRGHMSEEVFSAVAGSIDRLPSLQEVHLGGFGEPLLHPRALDFIDRLRCKGVEVSLSTNGTQIDEPTARALVKLGVLRVVVSVDSAKPEEFSQIRGQTGKLPRVLQGLFRIRDAKRAQRAGRPRLGIQTVLSRANASAKGALVQAARRVGASSLLVSHMLPYTCDMKDQILYTGPRHTGCQFSSASLFGGSGWPDEGGDWLGWGIVDLPRDRWRTDRSCPFVGGKWAAISAEGEVSPCYALMYTHSEYIFGRHKRVERLSFGNVLQDPLDSIWTSEEFVKFRTRVELFDFPACVDCELCDSCDFAAFNQNCWGDEVSCGDCLWAQGIIRCP